MPRSEDFEAVKDVWDGVWALFGSQGNALMRGDPRPFATKLRKKITPAMRKRIKKSSVKVQMVRKSISKAGVHYVRPAFKPMYCKKTPEEHCS